MPEPNPFLNDPQETTFIATPAVPPALTQRARGLKIVLICEMLLSLWMLFLGQGLLPILIVIPTNLIGFYGAHLLRKKLLTICIFMKSLIMGLVSYYLVSVSLTWATYGSVSGEFPILTCIFILVMLYQILCIMVAARIRNALIALEGPVSNMELGQVQVSEPVQPTPNVPAYPYPTYAPYGMPYMEPNGPQGYPVQFMYGYPAGQPAPGQPMPAVYPTYMYPQGVVPQGEPYTEAAEFSNNDQSALLHNVDK